MARAPSFGEVSVMKATRLADEPEFTVIRCLAPMKVPSRFSNLELNRPVVSQPSSEASTISFSSAPSISLPEGGTTVLPGTNGWGASAISAYSPTSASIRARRSDSFSLVTLVIS